MHVGVPEGLLDTTVSLLVELCRISSPSGDLSGLRRVATRLGEELARRRLACEVVDEPGSDGLHQPVLVARVSAPAASRLLLVGHLDTVLPAVEPRREGQRLWGTGALDMKGGLATLVGALDLLAARGLETPADLVLVAVPDEEVGGSIAEDMVRRWADGARAMLVLEPGEPRDGAETLVAGRRGLAEWHCVATGRAAHSGLAYWEGRSAAAAMAEWAAGAQALSERGAGATVNVARVVGGDADFVERLAEHHGLLGTARRRNVISDRAVAEGELRFLSSADRDRVLQQLAALAAEVGARHDVRLDLSGGGSVPPVDPDGPGKELVERTVRLAEASGWRLEVERDRGGISFPNYVADPAAVPIVDGLGPVGVGMHTRDECVDLDSLERRIALLADLLATL